MRDLTEADAIRLHDAKFWVELSYRERAEFQIFTDRLCMPFDVFHEAVEKTLGRPVFTHEFGLNRDGIRQELRGERPAPSFEEVIALIPQDKLILLAI